MSTRIIHPVLGFSFGFIAAMFLTILFLSWPIRALLSALLLGMVSLALLRGVRPSNKGWGLAAIWFPLGYAVAAILFVLLEMVFPPVT